MSRIISLKSENVKRIRCVFIEPTGNVVVISGKNAQGKSSVLDSIEMCLGGAGSIPAKPVRKGAQKAKVKIDLGEFVVARTFTAGGGTALKITAKDGTDRRSPQAILDAMAGNLTFDPLVFMRMKPPEKGKLLRQLAGLDFTVLDQKRQALYDNRTNVNRDAKALEFRLQSAVAAPEGTPDAEVSAAAILDEQARAQAVNAGNEKTRDELIQEKEQQARRAVSADARRVEIQALRDQLAAKEKELERIVAEHQEAEPAIASLAGVVAALKDVDLSEFAERCRTVEETNRAVRAKKARAELAGQLKVKEAEASKLTTAIEDIDADKREKIAAAKYPIAGLAVAEDGSAQFNGLPIDQASSAEQLLVSVSIGAALNPKLRVLLIRDGALLDTDSKKLLADFAAKNDLQIWVEETESGDEAAVIMEDGMVVGAVEAPEEAPESTQPDQESLL
jgi:hypothetical protein